MNLKAREQSNGRSGGWKIDVDILQSVTLLYICVCLVTWRAAICKQRVIGAPTGVHVLGESFSCEFRTDKHPDLTKDSLGHERLSSILVFHPFFPTLTIVCTDHGPKPDAISSGLPKSLIRCGTTRTQLMAKLFKIKLSVNFPFVHPSPTLCRAKARQHNGNTVNTENAPKTFRLSSWLYARNF